RKPQSSPHSSPLLTSNLNSSSLHRLTPSPICKALCLLHRPPPRDVPIAGQRLPISQLPSRSTLPCLGHRAGRLVDVHSRRPLPADSTISPPLNSSSFFAWPQAALRFASITGREPQQLSKENNKLTIPLSQFPNIENLRSATPCDS
ncbi:hypothetical protein HAX54_030549, partial [Datura stramonium]|nr:hypothetical protein [Datura stramonium]